MAKLLVPVLVDWENIKCYMEMHDIVEVVRCRDCRWHEQEQPGMVYCPRIVGNWVEEGWFCADGERRDDE